MARCLAVAMSQAPGLSGIPDSGHFSSAITRASCARSSARPTSRTIRARPAISLGDSILQTASMVRWVSEAVTATDQTILQPSVQDRVAPRLLILLPQLLPQLARLFERLARHDAGFRVLVALDNHHLRRRGGNPWLQPWGGAGARNVDNYERILLNRVDPGTVMALEPSLARVDGRVGGIGPP